jgi:DNA polymerase III delta prime subunit
MLPTQHTPACPEDFIGPAREAARNLGKIIAAHTANGYAPLKLYYSGPPGVGKTQLVTYAIRLLGVTKWAVSEYNGTDISIDRIRRIADELHLTVTELYGAWRVIRIEEADKITHDAQVKLLTVLDNLPARTAIFCTTNKPMKDMEERFQRRFKFTALTGPDSPDLEQWLEERWGLNGRLARNIAFAAQGNVGIALMEAEEWLMTREPKSEDTSQEPEVALLAAA